MKADSLARKRLIDRQLNTKMTALKDEKFSQFAFSVTDINL